jgi:hypothetical protein
MTTQEPATESTGVDPLARWRQLPPPPRPAELIASKSVTPARGAAEPAGDPDHEFMLRYAGG